MTSQPIQQDAGFMLLPPPKTHCQECGHQHPEDHPHNAQTMFYQVKFKMDHGRAPTWADAYSHCTPEIQAAWRDLLIRAGVDVDAGQINPRRK